MTRRQLMEAVVTLPMAAPALEEPARRDPGLIENRKPGALDWQSSKVRLDKRGGFFNE